MLENKLKIVHAADLLKKTNKKVSSHNTQPYRVVGRAYGLIWSVYTHRSFVDLLIDQLNTEVR